MRKMITTRGLGTCDAMHQYATTDSFHLADEFGGGRYTVCKPLFKVVQHVDFLVDKAVRKIIVKLLGDIEHVSDSMR